MSIPLEDLFQDIVGKAQRGLKLGDMEVARAAGLSVNQLLALKNGKGEAEQVAALAEALHLNPLALAEAYDKAWAPPEINWVNGLAQVPTDFMGTVVNAYVVWDPPTRKAAIIDTGVDARPLLKVVETERLQVEAIFITHTHQDHVAVLDDLVGAVRAKVYAPAAEPLQGATKVKEGDTFAVGNLSWKALLTNGHSAGGTTYLADGLNVPVALVGDSLFAGSMGGAPSAYQQALDNNRTKILSLAPETVLGPGHGPLTTVGEERTHNPFFG